MTSTPDWFEILTGFREESPDQVRANLRLDGERMISLVNGREMIWGSLETPNLSQLRRQVDAVQSGHETLSVQSITSDAQSLHADVRNLGAMFQVASQFNLLEMMGPSLLPEHGVGIYERDTTQGPACAVAAGAGTIYRNYFVPVNGRVGQSADNQIDCLADLGKSLGNSANPLWEMRNGYALASAKGLQHIRDLLHRADDDGRDRLREQLRIGLQRHTEVTINGAEHRVSQAYCSALPVGYSDEPEDAWEPFARLVLEAAYEATLCAAILNYRQTGNRRLYLTLLGGGVFGNPVVWILDAMRFALQRYRQSELEVVLVSHKGPSQEVLRFVEEFSG